LLSFCEFCSGRPLAAKADSLVRNAEKLKEFEFAESAARLGYCKLRLI